MTNRHRMLRSRLACLAGPAAPQKIGEAVADRVPTERLQPLRDAPGNDGVCACFSEILNYLRLNFGPLDPKEVLTR